MCLSASSGQEESRVKPWSEEREAKPTSIQRPRAGSVGGFPTPRTRLARWKIDTKHPKEPTTTPLKRFF